MPLRREQAKSGKDTTFASTVTATFDNTTQAGSIILLAWEGDTGGANAANTPTDTAGNVYTRVLSKTVAATFDLEIWYATNKAATASNAVTVTDTIGGSDGIVIIEEWTDADSITVVDKSNSSSGTGSPLTPGSISTLFPDDIIWVVGCEAVGASDLTAGAGLFNLTQDATTFTNLGICSTVVAANGTFNTGFTSIVSVSWACAQVAIRRAPSGTTTSTSSISTTSSSISSTSSSISSTSSSVSSTSISVSTSSTSSSISSTSSSTSSTSSSISSTSSSSTSASTSISTTSSSISSTSFSSTSMSSTSSSISTSSTSSSTSSTSSSISSTSASTSSTSFSSTSSSSSTSSTTIPANLNYSYEDKSSLPTSSANLTNAFTKPNVGNVTTDDGDYFIQFGSEYVMSEFKYKHINNSDNILVTWKGRSTESTTVSPLLLQIYNNNSAAWETFVRETRIAADVDFVMQAKVTANVSNYYDSNNVIVARAYQQVI